MSARKSTPDDRLSDYRAKRSASATREPFGGASESGGRLFVVQKHHASSLHWDLRLEMNGVLVSWAVPKGPSPNQQDKRLAVHVEDHPLEYADFEGVIPADNYGAGPSIVWDRGIWHAVEDPDEGMVKGKLLFDLKGYKLRGRWTLVRTKGGADNHWLLIKERDAYEDEEGGTEGYPDDSIFSGLTVDQLGAGGDHGAALRDQCVEAGAALAPFAGTDVSLMMAESRDDPFSKKGWVFEIKYDGYRMLGELADGSPTLISRNGNALTETFPEVARAIRGLPYKSLIVDGEVVVHDEAGLPSFQRIQKRGRIQRKADAQQASFALPATYYAFDLLAFEGYDLRPLPLTKRKELLKEVLPTVGPIRYSDHIPERGVAMYEQVVGMGLEGVVAKRADSIYVGNRSNSWLKIRAMHTEDFVVCGYTDAKSGEGGFGALHLSQLDGEKWVYAGRVGTGFTAKQVGDIGAQLRALPEATPPAGAEPVKGPKHHWVAPELVVEVQYKEWTEVGHLRHPSFLRLRDDKPPTDCVRTIHGQLEEPSEVTDLTVSRTVQFSNLDKVFWPDEDYRKGDLIEYYRQVSPWILPHLSDRPVVLTRFPDGINGKSFFQKNAPDFAPEWIRRVRLYSEGSERDLDYFVADDVETLLYVANSASIPLHIWQSRVSTIATPDFCVLDLDPKEAPFSDVVKIALLLREICEEIELPTFVKTSGSSGIHVLIPLGQQLTYEQSRTVGELLALFVVKELPDIATVTRRPSQREGKVYIDFLQNGHGRLIVAPYCVRPLPGAPVSAPLHWPEVNQDLKILDHTIKTMPARMNEIESDPLDGLLVLEPDLQSSLSRLAERTR
ncbi:MAG: DNA ligase D [Longimicrobiales bacterium]